MADPTPPVEHDDALPEGLELDGALETVEAFLLGDQPGMNRVQVAEAAGVELAEAVELWRLLGFAHVEDDEAVFTDADVEALRLSHDLVGLGILGEDDRSALVRTWGRSFARLAEWQTTLLARTAAANAGDDAAEVLTTLAAEVLPRVETLQTYVWRRHLLSTASRLLAVESPGSPVSALAVCFVDIVGFTSRSKELGESELVDWLEGFEDACSSMVTERGGRIIKNIGDEVLFVTDRCVDAAELALTMTERGEDEDDSFPRVRAGVAYGEVVSRLGDVFGPVVNLASRLTTVARPGAVLLDVGAYEELSGQAEDTSADPGEHPDFRFRRMRRTSVKGYSRLQPHVVRRR